MRVGALLPLRKTMNPARERLDHRMVALADLNGWAVRVVPKRERIDVVPMDRAATFSTKEISGLAADSGKPTPPTCVVSSR